MEFLFTPPRLANKLMCIYKMVLDNKHYYIGGTIDLGNRITWHKKNIRDGAHIRQIKEAATGCLTVTFEVVEILNERSKIRKREGYYLKRHVGLPLCLNTQDYSSISIEKRHSKEKVVKFNERGKQVGIYESIIDAAQSNGVPYYTIADNIHGKTRYTMGTFYFRRMGASGAILPPRQMGHRVKQKHAKETLKYNLNWMQVGSFRTISEAALDAGVDRGTITDSILGNLKKPVKGLYYYKFSDALK